MRRRPELRLALIPSLPAMLLSLLLVGCDAAPFERGGTTAAQTSPALPHLPTLAAAAPERADPATRSQPAATPPEHASYVVQPGDTLRSIAQRLYDDPGEWRRIYEANRALIGENPDALQVGMKLALTGPGPRSQLAAPAVPTRVSAGPALAPPPPPTQAAVVTPAAPVARATAPLPTQSIPPAAPVGTPTPVVQRLRGPASVPVSPRYEPLPLQADPELEARVEALLGPEIERYGLVVKRLSDGRGIAVDAERPFYAASLFKLAVMYEVFKQRSLGLLDFDERLAITPPYLEYQVGELRWPLWSEVPIRDLVEAMIAQSANIPAVLLHDKSGGWNILRDLRAIGLRQTNLEGEDLPTSAHDMALLLEMIARGQAVNPETSREMVNLLSRQQINDRLPALLPPGTRVAHKTGNWDNATHDVGIVYAPSGPYVIAVLSDRAWASRPIAELSRLVYDYFEAGAVKR